MITSFLPDATSTHSGEQWGAVPKWDSSAAIPQPIIKTLLTEHTQGTRVALLSLIWKRKSTISLETAHSYWDQRPLEIRFLYVQPKFFSGSHMAQKSQPWAAPGTGATLATVMVAGQDQDCQDDMHVPSAHFQKGSGGSSEQEMEAVRSPLGHWSGSSRLIFSLTDKVTPLQKTR